MDQKIAIYKGKGASLFGLKDLDALYLSEESFYQSDWDRSCSHFILPGGRDVPYHKTFKGAGNQKIRSFVERGGTFFGICAGAYFSCSFIEFEKGFPLEVCESRELNFFSGKAIGPAYGKGLFAYNSECGTRAAQVITSDFSFYAYYNGGCTFAGDLTRCLILASYEDLPGRPPAVIECRIGKGKAILSGVHFEISPKHLRLEDPSHAKIFPLLSSTDSKRLQFLDQANFPNVRPPMR